MEKVGFVAEKNDTDTTVDAPAELELRKPVWITDIDNRKGWPSHLVTWYESLNTPCTVQHFAAGLAFVFCLETGFIPESEMLPEAEFVANMTAKERLKKFTSQMQEPSSNQVYGYMFRSLVKNPLVVDSTSLSEEVSSNDTPSHSVPIVDSDAEDAAFEYGFTDIIKVVMEVGDDKVCLTGVPPRKADSTVSTIKFDFNILEFVALDFKIDGHGQSKKTMLEWMQELQLEGAKLASIFKSHFSVILMDAVGGLTNEKRGLVCLPPELVTKIVRMCDSDAVLNLSQVSHYLNTVANNPIIWKNLLWRDFREMSIGNADKPAILAAGCVPTDMSYDYKQVYLRQRRLVTLAALTSDDSDISDNDDFDALLQNEAMEDSDDFMNHWYGEYEDFDEFD